MTTATPYTTLPPQDIISIKGFLGQRFQANINKRLKDPVLREGFIRMYEHKNYRDWFWLGEQIGKWLDASAYAALINDDKQLLTEIDDVLQRLAETQEPDGYLGITPKYNRNPVRGMELYEWYYVLLGLLVCVDLLESKPALEIADKLGKYIIKTWGVNPGQFPLVGRYPGNGHDGGEGTLILEPIVLLGMATGDPAYLAWAEETLAMWDTWLDAYPESTHTCSLTAMKQYASGEKEIYELRDNIHAHTFHMTLLGLAALYNATGKTEYRDMVIGCVKRIADDWVFITGGMSSGERYIPHRFYHTAGEIEVCPQHTWILLLEQVYQWTGEAHYLDEIERTTFNQLLAAQLADGSNWSYMTPLNGRAQEPETPNCCNASGQRILAHLPCYLYGLRNDQPAVLMYTESSAVIHAPNLPAITLEQKTTFPADGAVSIQVGIEKSAHFTLHLRVPAYAAGATVSINGTSASASVMNGFIALERDWSNGDVIDLNLPFAITAQASDHEMAMIRGPLVYAYFQNGQPTNEKYHWHHFRHPSEIELTVHMAAPSLNETSIGDGLLGPALEVSGRLTPRAPMFASGTTNQIMLKPQDETITLLPFANQGKLRGQYQVFIRYRK